MSVIDLKTLSNDKLKQKISALISLDDWTDEYLQYKRPVLLHREGACTRQEKEPPDVIMEICSELRKRVKPIISVLKTEIRKETEDGLLFDGLKKLVLFKM